MRRRPSFISTEVAAIVHQVRERRENTAPPRPSGSAELITVDPTQVTTEQHREAGPIHFGYQFWQRLSLDRILHDCGLSETVRQLACAMVLNRLIAPASEHAMPDRMSDFKRLIASGNPPRKPCGTVET